MWVEQLCSDDDVAAQMEALRALSVHPTHNGSYALPFFSPSHSLTCCIVLYRAVPCRAVLCRALPCCCCAVAVLCACCCFAVLVHCPRGLAECTMLERGMGVYGAGGSNAAANILAEKRLACSAIHDCLLGRGAGNLVS